MIDHETTSAVIDKDGKRLVPLPQAYSTSFALAASTLIIAATLFFRWQLQDVLGERGLYSTFLPAVIIAAHFGGLWPGLFATLASALLTNVLLANHLLDLDPKAAADTVALFIFIATGIVISVLTESLHRSQLRWLEEVNRRIAEQSIRESDQRWRSLTQTLPQLIWTTADDGAPDYYSPQFLEFTGKSPQQLLDDGWHSVLHPDEVAFVVDRWAASVKSAQSYDLEHRIRKADGTYHWYKVRAVPVRNVEGGITRWLGSCTDITDLKLAEQSLLTAKEAAESANRMKDEFLANVSHEIRTPLNAILGMTEVVLSSPLERSQQDLLQTVQKAGENLLEIINDLLDFSKIEAGKLQLNQIPFSLHRVCQDVVGLLEVRAREQRLQLNCDIQHATPDQVMGDAGRLRQVLLNLVANAIKFTPRGHVELVVRPRDPLERDQFHVEFAVHDTGIGISPENQSSIFQAFEQEDMSVTRKYGGTGLGLTIASRIVRAMGGEIQLESTVGLGSTFRFQLPLQVVHHETETVAATTRVEPKLPAVDVDGSTIRRSLNVLAAEDNRFNAQLLGQVLGMRSHQLEVAEDGERALELAQSGRFDILLLDIHMPRKDGLTVARELRTWEQQNRVARLPVIALTARDTSQIRDECFAAGMDGLVQKPMRSELLFQMINQVMSPKAELVKSGTVDQLIDHERLRSISGGNEEILRQLAASFLEYMPQQLHEMQQCADTGDLVLLRESAHKIASSLATFSTTAGDLALTVEECAIQSKLADARLATERLARCCEVLCEQVHALE